MRHRRADGSIVDAVPAGVDVRTMVHEYGGAAWTVAEGTLYYSDVHDGRLYRIRPGGRPEPLTVPGRLRYADLEVDASRHRLICVGEDHSGAGEAVNRLVTVALDGEGPVAPEPLVEGADFYAAPRVSPDGRRLAWLSWSHPNMPWDGTTLWVGTLGADGRPGDARRVAGGDDAWIAQPRWSPDGALYYVGEATGWMNLYRWRDGATEPVLPMAADFARPDWVFGLANYAFVGRGEVLAVGRDAGRDRALAGGRDGRRDRAAAALRRDRLRGRPGRARPPRGRLGHRRRRPRRAGPDDRRLVLGEPQPRGGDRPGRHLGAAVHHLPDDRRGRRARPLLPAAQRRVRRPAGTLPPLIVTSHGGPTASAGAGLRLSVQYFTSRGLAVVDVDYRGSSGYGKAYRQALEGQWGVYDMDDCAAVAAYLVDGGPRRWRSRRHQGRQRQRLHDARAR